MGSGIQLDDADVALVLGRRILDGKPAEPVIQAVTFEFLASVLATRRPDRAACLHGAVDALAPGIPRIGKLASIRATDRVDREPEQRPWGLHLESRRGTVGL
jgi:hypothetical protein